MTLLDTNVISELMKPVPDIKVTGWVRSNPRSSLFTSAVTQAEILYGLAIIETGKRKNRLLETAKILFSVEFADRILPFDGQASTDYAEIMSLRRKSGKPISQFDAQISAIAKSRGLQIATRNTQDFEDCGIALINPWI